MEDQEKKKTRKTVKKISAKKTIAKKQEEVVKEKPAEEPKINIDTSSININSLDGKLLLVNVGTTAEPAETSDIENVRDELQKLLDSHNIKCLVYVSHHAVDMKIVG